jgi:CheY-like chemotaxis protein
LAFVDIGLPDISGREVAAELRKQFGNSIVLVALSGYGTAKDKHLSQAAGFDRHLTKPAPRGDIESVIAAAAQIEAGIRK